MNAALSWHPRHLLAFFLAMGLLWSASLLWSLFCLLQTTTVLRVGAAWPGAYRGLLLWHGSSS